MKKFLSVLLVMVMAASFSTSVFAEEYEFDIHSEGIEELPEYSFDVNDWSLDEEMMCEHDDCAELYAASVHRTHSPVTTNVGAQNINDSKKHRVTYTCRVCYQQYTKDVNHSFKYRSEQKSGDNVYHNYVKYCSKCGYLPGVTKQVKHSYNKGVCRSCGYQNTAKVYKAGGECSIYLAKPFNDINIYSNCPGCGSYSTTWINNKQIRKNQPIAGGKRITIYHQYVKCKACGKKYYNKCFHV